MKKVNFKDRQAPAKESKQTLHDAKVGARVRITSLEGDPEVCQRLREMGFCELSKVYKVAGSGALVCQTCGSKIALSGHLAKNIIVESIDQLDLEE